MSAVRLRDFFDKQGQLSLDTQRKSQIFDTIQNTLATPKPASTLRSQRYFKTALAAAFVFFFVQAIYTPQYFTTTKELDNVLVARTSGQVAQAGFVGEIVSIHGEITILRNGTKTQTSQLQNGDDVYLYNTSKATFTLRDGSIGSIEGPAHFTILEQHDSGLLLSINHARYIEIDKPEITDDKQDHIVTGELVIETTRSRITTAKNEVVHLALVTTKDKQYIQNKGAIITIESKATTKEVTQLATLHVAEVSDTVKVYEKIASVLDNFETSSSITQTYTMSGGISGNDLKTLLILVDGDALNGKYSHTTTDTYKSPKSTTIAQSSEDKKLIAAFILSTDMPDQGMVNLDNSNAKIQENEDITPVMAMKTTMTNTSTFDIPNQQVENPIALLESSTSDRQAATGGTRGSGGVDTATHIGFTSDIKNPLSNSQLNLLLELSKDSCITADQFTALQSAFGVAHTYSVRQLHDHIARTLYVSEDIQSLISHITICDDEKN